MQSLSRAAHALAAILALALPTSAQAPPRIVSMTPAHLDAEVDPTTTKLTVVFDQDMGGGRSLVGGGPTLPKLVKTNWENPRTLVIEVELEPDHDYALSLNSHTFTNFRSKQGVTLAPSPWSFTTLPAGLPDPKEQQRRNRQAFATLQTTLAEHYSYHDLRVKDWPELFAAAEPKLLAAKTDASWARAAARMLEPCADLHMYLRLGDRTFGTGRRAVDPLFRRELLDRYLGVKPAGNDMALYGRTDDGIGYLMIQGWAATLDLEAVGEALGTLLDCQAMIVDARANGGGDEAMAQRIAAWFVDGTKVYAKNRYRLRPGPDGFGPIFDRKVIGHQEAGRRFRMPIAVLTSRYVMSSNESFVRMLQQAADCTLIGQPTFGSSGNPKPHDLGNGVTIVLPSWQDLRLDGTCLEGEGIAPDVLVEVAEDDMRTKDPILERALATLRAKRTK